MYFAGKLISIYKQIGNAVPVNLARAVAKQLYKTLEEAA
jgi:site-specific DNA-cytosine methylase